MNAAPMVDRCLELQNPYLSEPFGVGDKTVVWSEEHFVSDWGAIPWIAIKEMYP